MSGFTGSRDDELTSRRPIVNESWRESPPHHDARSSNPSNASKSAKICRIDKLTTGEDVA